MYCYLFYRRKIKSKKKEKSKQREEHRRDPVFFIMLTKPDTSIIPDTQISVIKWFIVYISCYNNEV